MLKNQKKQDRINSFRSLSGDHSLCFVFDPERQAVSSTAQTKLQKENDLYKLAFV